ncbi:DUF1190 domain-containing protein [Methylosinus sp. H3A]|nr:DUF1190 domain-containing protein [Methylosinus sp. H3A]
MLLVAPRARAASSFLFDSPKACAASGRFSRQSCANAFANSLVELRERIPNFPTRWKCQLKYRLCEKDSGAEEAYRPSLLGVEIVTRGGEPVVTPILAIETPPRAFAAQPISRLVERDFSAGFAPILPAGRFQAKGKGPEDAPDNSFDTTVDVDEPPLREEAASATRESSAARRQRLRAAPFVQ